MNAQHLADTFLHEADDLLGQIEEAILELNEQPPTSEVINQLFRAFHTIKGSGAMFGFQAVADFTHHLETVLDLVREGSVPFSRELGELVLASTDQIKALFDSTKGGPAVSAESSQALIDSLNAFADIDAPAPRDAAPAAEPSAGTVTADLQRFRITFRPHRGIMARGADPGSLITERQSVLQHSLDPMTHPTHGIDEVHDLLLGSVPEVFGTMLSMNAEPGEPADFIATNGETMVAASVGFVGEANGVVYLHLTAPFARVLAGRMLGMEGEEFEGDEMVNDVIGELSNMVVGAVKSRLCDEGATCALTIPAFVRGAGTRVGATGGHDRRLLGFRCGEGGIVVELLMPPSV